MKRDDDYQKRREHLKNLTDEQLYERFWALAEQITQPMLDLGKTHTTPAVERSVLLRMGFSSVEVAPIVDGVIKRGLIGKGAGHVVWRLSEKLGTGVRSAGLLLADGKGWETVEAIFGGGAQ